MTDAVVRTLGVVALTVARELLWTCTFVDICIMNGIVVIVRLG
jgi:hypothetical protein